MKGIVFTEYLDYVEEQFGLEVTDNMVEKSSLPNSGAYTAVGTYDHGEMVELLQQLSLLTGNSIHDLLRGFGESLFHTLAEKYPELVSQASTAFDLLERIDGYIHIEVKKLYPDAELPKFTYEYVSTDQLLLVYESDRGLADLAEGLLRGCFARFGEQISVRRVDLPGSRGTHVRFELQRG